VIRASSASARPAGRPSTFGSLVERWRWYHFYFVLALFDLLVILTSIALYRRSLHSYEDAVQALSEVVEKQEFATNLRLALLELNAPGNDIFASRDLDRERVRFARQRAHIDGLLHHEPPLRLPGFEKHLGDMVRAEEGIFTAFERTLAPGADEDERQSLIDGASARMASMDRSQAAALRALVGVEQELQADQQSLLVDHERQLRASAAAGRWFSAAVLMVLAGTFWFGRILQRANERMQEDSRRAAEARQANLAAIGEVCATVAHGIRNPLAAISAAAQVGSAGATEGPAAEALQDILAEAHRLDERARRLLDFARPLEPQLDVQDVTVLLDELGSTLASHHRNVDVRVECPRGLSTIADRAMLWEALYELGTNGIRAMDNAGRLGLQATVSGEHVAIRVVDHGPGIPEAVRSRLFELFFTTRYGGTGVGLATVRKLVETQGGRVTLEQTGPTGTVFRIELPRAPA
jgi:signal transduction histidine kinase